MPVDLPLHETSLVPEAPNSIQKDVPLKTVLNDKSIRFLARNIQLVHPDFDVDKFYQLSIRDFEEKTLMERGDHIADALFESLSMPFSDGVSLLVRSFTPAATETGNSGLKGFFYLPHSSFIARYGVDPDFNGGNDGFEHAMAAQYELTTRFTAEFSIRPFLITYPEKTLSVLMEWLNDPNLHVRRLCSEGTRPKLPWGKRIQAFVQDPTPVLPILNHLKDDESLYVRRSVANHLGDIGKDHPQLLVDICEQWLTGASDDRKWLIRHALRYPAKKGMSSAIDVRLRAK